VRVGAEGTQVQTETVVAERQGGTVAKELGGVVADSTLAGAFVPHILPCIGRTMQGRNRSEGITRRSLSRSGKIMDFIRKSPLSK